MFMEFDSGVKVREICYPEWEKIKSSNKPESYGRVLNLRTNLWRVGQPKSPMR